MSLSSSAFFWENFAGTVSVFAGAPGTARAPFTKTELSAGLSLGACELGSSLPILPDGVCCAFSCCCFCCGSTAGDCWAAALHTAAKSVRTRKALVRKSSRRMLLVYCHQCWTERAYSKRWHYAFSRVPSKLDVSTSIPLEASALATDWLNPFGSPSCSLSV